MVLLTVISAVSNTLILTWFVRRLIGVPVGWPRTALLSLFFAVGMSPVVALYSQMTAIDYTDGLKSPDVPTVLLLLLLVGWLISIEAAILTFLEAIIPTGEIPDPMTAVRIIAARRRRFGRYLVVMGIVLRHGLLGYFGRRQSARLHSDTTAYQMVVDAFNEAGVTFIKLGQMIATRPDIVPPALARSLAQLQSDAQPEPWENIEPLICARLDSPVGDVFEYIDPTPLAAASVAQVHSGRLRDGQDVVVKVQRPKARSQVMVDLDIMQRIAVQLEARARWARNLGLTALIRGFAASLHEELDYTSEIENTLGVENALDRADGRKVRTPTIYTQYSGSQLLVMGRVSGRSLADADEVLDQFTSEQRRQLADDLVACVMTQILDSGTFHADLHAGNVFVDDYGTLTLIDFGSVGRLGRTSRDALRCLLIACCLDNPVAASDALVALLGRPADLDDRQLEQDLGQLLTRFHCAGPVLNSQRLVSDMFSIVVRHGFSVPDQVAAAFRCLGALDGTLRALHPDASAMESAERQQERLFSVSGHARAAATQMASQSLTIPPLLQRLPRHVDNLLTDLDTGNLRVGLAGPGGQTLTRLGATLDQFLLAAVAGACAMCGVLLMLVTHSPGLTPTVPLTAAVGAALLLFGFTLATRILARLFRSGA